MIALAWPCGSALAQTVDDASDFGSVRTDLPTTGSVSFSGDAVGTGDTGSGITSITGTFSADWDFGGQFGSFLLDLPDFDLSGPLTGSLATTDGILTGAISGIDDSFNIVNGSVTGFLANGPVNGLPEDFVGTFEIPGLSATGSFTSDEFFDAMASVLRLNALDDNETTAEDEFPNIVLTTPTGNETETFDAFAGACAGAGTGSDLEADCNTVSALAPDDLAVALDAVTPDEVSAIGNTVQGSTNVQRQSITTRMTTVRTAGNLPRVSTQGLTFGLAGARFSMADIVADMQRRSIAADPFWAARDELASRRLSAPGYAGYRPVPRMLPEHWYFDAAAAPPEPADARRVVYTDRAANPKAEGVLAQAEGADQPSRFSGNEFGRLGFFVSGNVGFGEKDETSRESGYDVAIYNVTAGADYRLRDDLLVGAAFSYGTSEADFDNDGGEANADSWGANVYASASRGPVFVDALVGYTIGELDTERKIVFGSISRTADGNADTRQLALSLAAGYDLQRKALRITPRVTFDYTDNKVDSFSESGAGSFNLSYDEQDFESAQAGAEISVGYVTTQPVPGIGDTLLQLNARLAYKHEFADDDRAVDIAYVSSPSSTFSVETDDPDRDFMEAGVGVGASFGGGLSAFADLGTQIGKSDESLTNVTIGVRYQVAF